MTEQTPEPVEPTPVPPLEQTDPVHVDGPVEAHDDEDVEAALARETQDGSGFENEHELPTPDFDGFPSDEVEVEVDDEEVQP